MEIDGDRAGPGVDDGKDVEVGALRAAVVQLAKAAERHRLDRGGGASRGLAGPRPLPGGGLPGTGDQELADLIRPDPIPAQACVLAVASCPEVTDVLIAAFSARRPT
ncbi:hypothetical protein [Streptomyces griseofuscus]|uniref:hypothetical protein n=1 Tax=Streptomyces griseofuscus TaxID=146922 RepID=UPI00382548AC